MRLVKAAKASPHAKFYNLRRTGQDGTKADKKNVDEAGLCETSIRAEAHSLATSRGSERNFSRGYEGRYRPPKSYWAPQAINQ